MWIIGSKEILYETYKYQMMYYSWFWTEPFVKLIVLVDGWNLQSWLFDFRTSWEFVENHIKDFSWFIKNGIIPIRKKLELKKLSISKELDFISENALRIKSESATFKIYKERVRDYLNNSEESKEITLKNGYVKISKRAGKFGYDKQSLEDYFEENNLNKYDFMSKSKDNEVVKIKIQKQGDEYYE